MDSGGRVLTVFRSRLAAGDDPEYAETAARMLELAAAQPGFVSFDHYAGTDGERVSIIVFESLDDQRAWRDHAEHAAAQRLGKDRFYESFTVQVCALLEERRFARPD